MNANKLAKGDPVNQRALSKLFANLMSVNPNIQIYLLDDDGTQPCSGSRLPGRRRLVSSDGRRLETSHFQMSRAPASALPLLNAFSNYTEA